MPQLTQKKLYHWEGRHLLLDTVVHHKRTIGSGKSVRPCPFDIRRWIMPPDDEMMGRTWQRLSRQYQRYLFASRGHRPDAKAKVIWHYLVEQIAYVGDDKRLDLWQFPPETLMRGMGDCEDKAFLCASLLLAAGIPAGRVRVTIGAFVSLSGGRPTVSGHAWPMYRNARGIWCILEPNLPHLPIKISGNGAVIPRRRVPVRQGVFLSADRFASDTMQKQYVPLVCFNHQNVWSVEQIKPGSVAAARHLEPDWSRNPTFDEILSWHRRQNS